MPFEIVRRDIAGMRVDAIVQAANPGCTAGRVAETVICPTVGSGLRDVGGKRGGVCRGEATVTTAVCPDGRFVIYAAGPVWQGGDQGEEAQLSRCCRRVLEAAGEKGCRSVAFPLISVCKYGFPMPLALQTVIREIGCFLADSDMQIYLVAPAREDFRLPEALIHCVKSYVDDNYIPDDPFEGSGLEDRFDAGGFEMRRFSRMPRASEYAARSSAWIPDAPRPVDGEILQRRCAPAPPDWDALLSHIDAGFSETLLALIDRSGQRDAEVYRRANVDRKLFSKIRNNPDYRPSKPTALSFAIALELDLEETQDFIARAGYTLTHSSKFDVIVEYFIVHGNYNIHELNAVLFEYDQPLLCV